MDIFLTGGTGYLGSKIARALVGAGHRVRLLYRDSKRLPPPKSGSILPVRGSLDDPGNLIEAIRGADAVIHTAAMVRSWVRDPAAMEQTNVHAVSELIDVSKSAGVSRFIYTSSFMALGPTGGKPVDETRDPRRESFFNDYERTKFLGDQAARRAADAGAPVVTLYPTVIFGPGALTAGNHVGKIIRDFLRRRLPGRIGTGEALWNYGYVDDIVNAHVLAVERGRPGSRYILGGENVTMNDFLSVLEEVSGVPAPTRTIPAPVATAIALAYEAWAHLTDRAPDLTRDVLKIYDESWAYTSSAAERDLGYRVTPFRDALAATVAWARQTLGARS